MHDPVAGPKPESFLTRPDGFSRVPIKGKAYGDPSDNARDGPHSEEDQTDVAESLETRERKDTSKLKKKGGLEDHDGDVVAQRGDEDQLYLALTCRRQSWGPWVSQITLSKADRSSMGRVST